MFDQTDSKDYENVKADPSSLQAHLEVPHGMSHKLILFHHKNIIVGTRLKNLFGALLMSTHDMFSWKI